MLLEKNPVLNQLNETGWIPSGKKQQLFFIEVAIIGWLKMYVDLLWIWALDDSSPKQTCTLAFEDGDIRHPWWVICWL